MSTRAEAESTEQRMLRIRAAVFGLPAPAEPTTRPRPFLVACNQAASGKSICRPTLSLVRLGE